MRLGLCCTFAEHDIRFRTTTARALQALAPEQRLARLRAIASDNAAALRAAIGFCRDHGIGSFRINSQVLPLRTHPALGYDAAALGDAVVQAFVEAGQLARASDVRLSFHPDQFVVLSSPDPAVVASALAELEYQAEVAGWVGADVINVHGGGVYGDKPAALARLAANVARLSPAARSRLTLENDDRCYTPADLLPVCRALRLPLVYDAHHHRCLPDGLSVEAATAQALATWDREPLFHISSPREGWRGANPRSHADHVDVKDLPRCWDGLRLTVEVEAKAKELAVIKLAGALQRRRARSAA